MSENNNVNQGKTNPVLSIHKVDDKEFEKKSLTKQWLFLAIQLILSLVGAFAIYNSFHFDAWTMVMNQEISVIVANAIEAVLFIVFLFIGSTAYAKGLWNTITKWFGITIPIVLIVVINWVLLEKFHLPIGSGLVVIVSISVFYFMFSTSSASMNPMGFVFSVAGLVIGIMAMNTYLFNSELKPTTLVTLGQFALAMIFFLGINFSKISYALTGVLNTQKANIPGGDSSLSGNEENNDGEG